MASGIAEKDSAPADDAAPQSYGLDDQQIGEIRQWLDEGAHEQISAALAGWHYADIAELLGKVTPEERGELLEAHGAGFPSDAYAALDPEIRRSALSQMPAERVADLLDTLESDDALDLILPLSAEFQQAIIHHLSAHTRVALEQGLKFPEDSAGRLMQREFVAVPQFWTVGKTIDYLRAAAQELPEDFFVLLVISPSHQVVGEIPLSRLFRAGRSAKLESLSMEEPHPIPADMDQEEVAHIFRRDGLASAPVVDDYGRLIGVITIDDVLDVIDEEAQEDFLNLAGVQSGDLYSAVLATSSSRFRWLFVNLLTAILASGVIAMFDATIQEIVALAVLMPIVASMGGNAGTQALTVAVRGIATRSLSGANAMAVIWKEALVGLLNGLAFAVITGIVAALWFGSNTLGVIIAIAMIVNLLVAGLCGAGIPVLLHRMGSDPALSSTVFLTTVTDVVGFFAFLGLASLFLL